MLFRARSKYNWRDVFLKYGNRLASLTNHEEVYKTLLITLVEVSGAEGASLILFDSDLGQFALKEHLGPTPLSFALNPQHPVILWLRRDGRPLSRHQLIEDKKLIDLKSAALTYFSEWNVEAAFPLIAEKKFLGIFNLGPRGNKAYEQDDLELFSTLIGLGSVFIENSHFYETLLKQNQKLSEVARLKTQFVSNVTHELRTPLHGILGLAEILLEDPQGILPEDYRRYLEMIKNSGDSLRELVDHILDLTKYQSGLVHLEIKKVDLKKVFLEASHELQSEFERQKCEFEMDWPENTPWVYGDEAEIRHLIDDLLGNAVKFTSQGKITVAPTKTGERLKVCLRDTGIGIEEKDQTEIFDDFRQAEADHTRSFGGGGLGLALAKKIVELHGGRIWVESKKGSGSYFYFTLPLNPALIQRGVKDSPSPNSHSAERPSAERPSGLNETGN